MTDHAQQGARDHKKNEAVKKKGRKKKNQSVGQILYCRATTKIEKTSDPEKDSKWKQTPGKTVSRRERKEEGSEKKDVRKREDGEREGEEEEKMEN